MNDPINGDQIRQKESRTIYGMQSSHNHTTRIFSGTLTLENGLGFRYDDINGVELSDTRNRSETLNRISLADIDEFNGFLFSNATWEFRKWMVNAGLRMDHFLFEEVDLLATSYQRNSARKSFISPKLNVIYNISDNWQFYAKSGRGYHSNDARVVIREQNRNTLPAALGYDLGTIYKPTTRLIIDVAFWELYLEQEFVYVGDAGIVEPSGKTKRSGVDLGINYQLNDRIFAFTNLNYARPRSTEEPEGENFIPLAPTLTSIGGLSYQGEAFNLSLRYRYIRDRAANEDNSVTAEGYFITDLTMSYDKPGWALTFAIENLLDEEWREAQFDTESRLANEAEPVSEIHFTPGTPFFMKAGLTFKF